MLVVVFLSILALAAIFFLIRIRSRQRPTEIDTRSDSPPAPDGGARPLLPEIGSVISGKAYVTDGDGLRVSGYRIRFAGLDAPELDQWAKHRSGYWFKHGKRVKNALIQAIGGKHVRIAVEGYDQYDRVVGTVTCDDKDVGEWLVRNGHAVAAYGDRYKQVEREARQTERGRWGHTVTWHPRDWRLRNLRKG